MCFYESQEIMEKNDFDLKFLGFLWRNIASYGVLTAVCGKYEKNSVAFKFVGDGYKVFAISGRDGSQCVFSEDWRTKTFTLTARFKSTKPSDCLLEEVSPITKIYKIKVYVRVLLDIMDTGEDPMYEVTCTFGKLREGVRYILEAELPKAQPPKVVAKKSGPPPTSSYNLLMKDRNGEDFKFPPSLGQAITLKVIMKPGKGEVGFRVDVCRAETLDGSKSVVILADGCGTGFPIPRDKGFVGEGTEGLSAPFRLLRISKYGGLTFKCTFISCKQNCDGNSCVPPPSKWWL